MRLKTDAIARVFALILAIACPLLLAAPAQAHGIWAHVHVTGWAIENLEDEELRDFFADPEVKNAALFGAAFTDSGYWPQGGEHRQAARAYTEHTHWEPFIESAVAWLLENDPPPWDDLESKKRVAFIMGAASHGLQDELFDTLFLPQIAMHDGAGQDEADPASDGFLALDDHLRFAPVEYIPLEMLLEIYNDDRFPLGHTITEETIRAGVDLMTTVYLTPRAKESVRGLGIKSEDDVPWTRAYYLDPSIPGSLRAEILPTRAYITYLWERLHQRHTYEGLLIHAYPDVGRLMRSGEPDTPDSWVSFVFGVGVKHGDFSSRLADEELDIIQATGEVATTQHGTRWGGEGSWGRIVTLRPTHSMRPGMWHIASMRASEGAILDNTAIPMTREQATWTHRFQVACSEQDPSPCEGVTEPEPLPISPPPMPDMGPSLMDMDGMTTMPDMGTSRADMMAERDLGSDDPAADMNVGPAPSGDSDALDERGCGCALAPPKRGPAPWLVLLLGCLLFASRLRRTKERERLSC